MQRQMYIHTLLHQFIFLIMKVLQAVHVHILCIIIHVLTDIGMALCLSWLALCKKFHENPSFPRKMDTILLPWVYGKFQKCANGLSNNSLPTEMMFNSWWHCNSSQYNVFYRYKRRVFMCLTHNTTKFSVPAF